MGSTAATRTNTTYNMLAMLLVAGLVTGAALLFLTTNAATGTAELTVGLPEPMECPFNSGVPVCYRYDVVNTGTAPAFVRCEVIPAGDTTAVFGNGETAYEGVDELAAGKGWHLVVQVRAGADDVVSEPMVGCGQVS